MAGLGAQAAFAYGKCLLGSKKGSLCCCLHKCAHLLLLHVANFLATIEELSSQATTTVTFLAAAYNAQDYLNLPVSKEVQDLFQLIGRSAGAAALVILDVWVSFEGLDSLFFILSAAANVPLPEARALIAAKSRTVPGPASQQGLLSWA